MSLIGQQEVLKLRMLQSSGWLRSCLLHPWTKSLWGEAWNPLFSLASFLFYPWNVRVELTLSKANGLRVRLSMLGQLKKNWVFISTKWGSRRWAPRIANVHRKAHLQLPKCRHLYTESSTVIWCLNSLSAKKFPTCETYFPIMGLI